MTTDECVRLRPVQAGDLPRIFDMQFDPESNRMAVTIPRTLEAFDAHWAKALDDPGNTTRAVLVGEELVGYISCFLKSPSIGPLSSPWRNVWMRRFSRWTLHPPEM